MGSGFGYPCRTLPMASLKIEGGLVICGEEELNPFISHPDHITILAHPGMDVGIKAPNKFPEAFQGKYNLRIVESLLIQSWYIPYKVVQVNVLIRM